MHYFFILKFLTIFLFLTLFSSSIDDPPSHYDNYIENTMESKVVFSVCNDKKMKMIIPQ